MATGPFNESEHAVTNDIPEPIGYTANGQFAASLTLLHNKQTSRKDTPQRRMHGRSIEDKWTGSFMLKLSLLVRLQDLSNKAPAHLLQLRMHITIRCVVAAETSVEDRRSVIHNRGI